MKHLIKPARKTNDLVIKTAVKPRGPGLPSKRPFGHVYQAIKTGVQLSGYYDKYDLRRYDPDYLYEKYVKRYTYKPRKRVTGYALSTKGFLKKTPTGHNKLGKTYSRPNSGTDWNYCNYHSSKSGYCSQ